MTDPNLQINALLDHLEASITQQIKQRDVKDPLMVGIHTGGAWIATELHARLGLIEPVGLLDISFYRDDFSEIGIQPQVKPSKLPFNIEGRDLLLVDDVLYTGRTIRAALNEIFEYGRPSRVLLAILIDRDGRQIPIQADCVGVKISLTPDQRIKLIGPDPLQLHIHSMASKL